MGVQRLEDLIAWQLANAFKVEVYRLIRDSRGANADLRFCDQLRGSAASVEMNIGEGFYRFGAREIVRFLSIALGSLGEATLWLRDGIDRQHFAPNACDEALMLAKRCRVATLRLQQSLTQTKRLERPTAPSRAGPEAPRGPDAHKEPALEDPQDPKGPTGPR